MAPLAPHVLMNRFVDHVRPLLAATGDYDMVLNELHRVTEQGNGVVWQRRAWQRRHDGPTSLSPRPPRPP